MKYLLRITAPFIAPEVVSNPPTLLYQKAIFLVLALMIIAVSSLISIAYYASIGAVLLAAYSVMIFLTCSSALVILKLFRNIQRAAYVLIFGLLIANTAAALQTGGVFSIIIFSYSIVAILGLVFFHRRAMAQILCLSVAIVLVLMLLEAKGWTPAPAYKVHENWFWFGSIMIILLCGTVGVFFFLDAIREKAYELLEQERNSVEERIRAATQTLQEQQNSISRINEHLEERNIELQRAIHAAEAAQQLQADILRNMDHEMRTPLSVILGFAEILHQEAAAHHPEFLTFVEQISHAGSRLLRIFNNASILTVAPSRDVEVQHQPIDLPSFLQQQVRSFKAEAEQNGLALTCSWSPECEKPLTLDADATEVILHQLLSNAVKFTNQGSVHLQCAIRTPADTSSEGVIEFRVMDTGIGIEPQFLDKMFMPFQQQDASTTRRFGGLGLGLAVVSKMVELLHGRVWCESELGKGATFVVELPTLS